MSTREDSTGTSLGDTTLRAGAAVLAADRVIANVEVRIEHGRIASVEPALGLTPQEKRLVLTAGLVDAHAHLDLGALAGALPAGPTFVDWVGRVVRARAELSEADVAAGVRRSADALVASGTTSVIDIDATGAVADALGDHPLRAVLLREVIDGSPEGTTERSASALEAAREALGRPATERRAWGISPHGTHSVGDALLADLGRLRPPGPVAVHWAETEEEVAWLAEGTGPFADWLGPSPRVSGTERLARAGLLDGALLVHGNHPADGEIDRAARAGATVVHCPGSHLFFDRPTFPVDAYRAAGVALALGTDSWASNDGLDMRRETRLARASLGVDAETAWRMATEEGARLLPWSDVTGRLDVGAAADVAVFDLGDDVSRLALEPSRLLDALTATEPDVADVFIAGRRARA